jgi:hypothetical protein
MCNGLGEYNCAGSGLKKTTTNARIQTKPCTLRKAKKKKS